MLRAYRVAELISLTHLTVEELKIDSVTCASLLISKLQLGRVWDNNASFISMDLKLETAAEVSRSSTLS